MKIITGGELRRLNLGPDIYDKELGLEALLKYVSDPRYYTTKVFERNAVTDNELEEMKDWARSRAKHILEKLFGDG